MRKLLYLATLIFISCDQPATIQQKKNQSKESKFKKLLSKYNNISFDTLIVFSAEDLESSTYKFKGTQLDSTEVLLFPENITEQYLSEDGYYACFKFSIDSNRIGLITRTPSTYEPSSVKLLIFDRLTDRITDFIELAETFGDAGDMAQKTSWLFKDTEIKYKSFTWLEESYDHSAEDEKDTTVDHWNFYFLIDISKPQVDTVSKDEKSLLNRFGNLIDAKARK